MGPEFGSCELSQANAGGDEVGSKVTRYPSSSTSGVGEAPPRTSPRLTTCAQATRRTGHAQLPGNITRATRANVCSPLFPPSLQSTKFGDDEHASKQHSSGLLLSQGLGYGRHADMSWHKPPHLRDNVKQSDPTIISVDARLAEAAVPFSCLV